MEATKMHLLVVQITNQKISCWVYGFRLPSRRTDQYLAIFIMYFLLIDVRITMYKL